MPEIIRQSFIFERLAGGPGGAQSADRCVDVIASTTAPDSYGDIVVQDWDLARYLANPVVLYGHNSWTFPIGYAKNVGVVDGKLRATLCFVDEKANPQAEQVWQGILQGSLRAVSVGFIPKNARMELVDGTERFVLSGNELLEISVVPIPANPEAIVAEQRKNLDAIRELATRSTAPREASAVVHERSVPMFSKLLLTALTLAVTATPAEVETRVTEVLDENERQRSNETALLEMTGAKSVSEALGIVKAGKVAADELPKVQERLKSLEAEGAKRDLDALIAQGVAEKKLTPALKAWAETQPLAVVKSFLEKAPAIPALIDDKVKQPGTKGAETGAKWEDMKPGVRAKLFHDDRAAYEALKGEYEQRTGKKVG